MPLVSAWRCNHTKKLFLTKEEYICHLKKLAGKKMIEFKVKQAKEMRTRQFKKMHELNSFTKIERWIVKNSDLFVLGSCKLKDGQEIPKIVKIEFTNMRFNTCVSNTHNAPAGKPTNWGRDKNLPKGYIGWKGRVKFKVNGVYSEFPRRLFEGTGVHFGSGSGINIFEKGKVVGNVYSADVIFFAEEWPGLTENQVLIRLSAD